MQVVVGEAVAAAFDRLHRRRLLVPEPGTPSQIRMAPPFSGVETSFRVTTGLDRMGVRLEDPAGLFREQRRLSLVSDAIVPGDIQILGDGTPIVLMRDHQPTGGYPRIATIVSADLDRFAQMRPGTELVFRPVQP